MKSRAVFVPAVLLLVGCTLGPNYHRPTVKVPTVYRGVDESAQAETRAASYADLPWWQVFKDPVLQELIHTALRQNYDLQLATERINQARAQFGITRSAQYPQVETTAGFSGGTNSSQFTSNFFTAIPDLSLQLDLFGHLRRATEAARAQILATEYAQKAVILTLVSDVATDYFHLLELDLELQIAWDTVNSQQQSVRITSLRADRGAATKLDVLQAHQVLDSARAQIPDLQRQIAQAENAISIILGNYPKGVPRGHPLAEQPLPPEIPLGIPSSLLERRPDIRQAEQLLIAANAQIGVARAAFFPQISLTGSGGRAFGRSTGFSGLISTTIWSSAAQTAQPIFTAGALRSNLRLTESEQQQALVVYEQTIQRAFGDVSDALISHQKLHQVRENQEATVKDLQESVRLSLLRYRGGITTYLEVLDGQRALFSAELSLAQARGDEYQSLVQLFRSLGGGWRQ